MGKIIHPISHLQLLFLSSLLLLSMTFCDINRRQSKNGVITEFSPCVNGKRNSN